MPIAAIASGQLAPSRRRIGPVGGTLAAARAAPVAPAGAVPGANPGAAPPTAGTPAGPEGAANPSAEGAPGPGAAAEGVAGPGAAAEGVAGPGAAATPPSAWLAQMGSNALMSRVVIGVMDKPLPLSPLYSWYVLRIADRLSGKRVMPDFLRAGPVKDTIDVLLVGHIFKSTIDAVPQANRELRGSLRAARSARGAVGVGDVARALVRRSPEAAGAVADAAVGAARAQRKTILQHLLPLAEPLMKFGYTAISAAGIIGLGEYLREHGTKGLLSTRSGRGAALDAIDGALTLPALWMPVSPLQVYIDLGSGIAAMASVLNGVGLLDPLLGGDPPVEDADPGATLGLGRTRL